ncbi:MAG: hypothetical protein HRT54_05120 [Colwellia sp.]|nr:hypothetical protein [Colwellia sp.]
MLLYSCVKNYTPWFHRYVVISKEPLPNIRR